mgnify:CR=1 FL=1
MTLDDVREGAGDAVSTTVGRRDHESAPPRALPPEDVGAGWWSCKCGVLVCCHCLVCSKFKVS